MNEKRPHSFIQRPRRRPIPRHLRLPLLDIHLPFHHFLQQQAILRRLVEAQRRMWSKQRERVADEQELGVEECSAWRSVVVDHGDCWICRFLHHFEHGGVEI